MTVATLVPLRKLGNTDLLISPLGLGCWQFSKGNGFVGRFWSSVNQKEVEEIVKISLEGGINWFDTAEVYGKGESERALAEALNNLGVSHEQALIATKWWPLFRNARTITGTIGDRISALKGRPIDLYQIHHSFSLSTVKKEMMAMSDLLKRDQIKSVGVSNFSARKMRIANETLKGEGFVLASNQMKYSLLDRRIETNGTLDTAKELGITIIAYSPLELGILSGKFHKNPEILKNLRGPRKYLPQFKQGGLEKTKPLIDLLDSIGDTYNVSASQVALNWLIHFHGETVVVIPGATKIQHAKDNIGALRFKLTDGELDAIDKASRKIAKF